ncbi:interleukin-12 subunit alpha [Polypterus senegalus]|uniref:interleukin-12 subunit alpha n=1 Tax=Polypterus senegalus TaxID=55291 RepID=UPI001963EE0A|nr:interleukin-12 subunit alpha [Polypterus senegalus]
MTPTCTRLCVAACMLLATIFSSLPNSYAKPVSATNYTKCLDITRQILDNMNNVNGHNFWMKLNVGFNCTSDELKDITNGLTVSYCEPDVAGEIFGCQRKQKAPFSKEDCLKSITSDILIYKEEIKNNVEFIPNDFKLTDKLDELVKALGISTAAKIPQKEETDENSFSKRWNFCKVLQSFKLRIITVSRALNYIKATS